MIQVVRVFDAYPMEYRTFANIDFSTVKGLSTSYELLATGNLSLRASYTLQFAEGTGSNATSQLNLARSGEPNLRAPMRLTNDQRHQVVANVDYRFGDEKYNGPLFRKRVKVLKNTGANLTVRGGSGEPYNPQANFTSAALYNNNPAPLQVGSINGATLPWKFRFDLRLDKQLGNVRKDSSKHALDMNVYVQVLNLFNTRNINRVYRATGNPDDDGYLSSPAGKAFTASQNSPGSFMDYYSMKLMDPSNWELPRRLRFGVKMSF